jgi:predicted transglutaminase-like cysteine proteinase
MNSVFLNTVLVAALTILINCSETQATPLSRIGEDAGKPYDRKYIPSGRPTLAPYAFVRFCAANPSQCEAQDQTSQALPEPDISNGLKPLPVAYSRQQNDPALARLGTSPTQNVTVPAGSGGTTAGPVELTAQRRDVLQRINRRVNASIRPQMEAAGDDLWQIAPVSGDCEDYALTKRRDLIEQGWPAHVLRMATARTFEGEAHAVLVVTTSQGDIVLDNRTNVIKPWNHTDLRFIKVQSAEDPRQWGQM